MMMVRDNLTELPHVSANTLEDFLVSDDVFTLYFNDFLSLPCFSPTLQYNQETGLFEVPSDAAELVSTRISDALQQRKHELRSGDSITQLLVDNQYIVCCLDKEQGLEWIIKEKLPFFLQSNCYNEYRLAKTLLYWIPNGGKAWGKSSAATQCCFCSYLKAEADRMSRKVDHLTCLFYSQRRKSNTEDEPVKCASSCPETATVPPLASAVSSSLGCEDTPAEQGIPPSQEPPRSADKQELTDLSDEQLEGLAQSIVEQVLQDVLAMMNEEAEANKPALTQRGDPDGSCESKVCQCSPDREHEELKQNGKGHDDPHTSGREEKPEWGKTDKVLDSGGSDKERLLGICCHDTCCHDGRPGLDEFKKFLCGTSGDKILNLWLDIERLNGIKHSERKESYLALMRSRYLLSSNQNRLNMELISRLGLITSSCWTEEKLQSVQPHLTETLFRYWAPRFWTSQYVKAFRDEYAKVLIKKPTSAPSHQPSWQRQCTTLNLPPLCPDAILAWPPHSVQLELHNAKQLLDSSQIESMLQALCVEAHAGMYTTGFCETSGNQLWANAVYFWTDLQHYHELFYQDGLDPYRVQREAQLLYTTYLFSSAKRSLGVDEETRKRVYNQLQPAFEDVFDEVAEHTLNILLEAWRQLISRDTNAFHQLGVHDEVRHVDNEEYRELRSLYDESQRKQSDFLLFSADTGLPDAWSKVHPRYQGYRLASLFRHHHEIRYFRDFLEKLDASIHLQCWLDLREFRMIPPLEEAERQEKSAVIVNKYLNRRYFFSPDGPANIDEQNSVLSQAGGLERIKQGALSDTVVKEIQQIVKNHIENTWLPLFLASTEFIDRQTQKSKLQAAERLSQQQRRRTKRAGKSENLWMTSSKEILLFRRILLNPGSAEQFQRFVSVKGEFMEKNILFWQEVQRYKELCHSNCDNSTIHRKINTIVNCFINSAMPPSLQINIPHEQAQNIMENQYNLGPYVFREAQMSVFGELLRYWPEFQKLTGSIQEEKLLPLLEERRMQHKAKLQRQRRKLEDEEARKSQEDNELRMRVAEESEDEYAVEDGQARKNDKERMTVSRTQLYPKQPLSWSYSKYIAALKKEEVKMRRQGKMPVCFTPTVDTTSVCSGKSTGSKRGRQQLSTRSSRSSKR
ncbi:regulator of G-protein signaling 22 [Neosynchiropus ocellatus]